MLSDCEVSRSTVLLSLDQANVQCDQRHLSVAVPGVVEELIELEQIEDPGQGPLGLATATSCFLCVVEIDFLQGGPTAS